MCPRCSVKLIPVIYGKVTPELVDMERQGKLIVGSGKYVKGKPSSFCISCEEAYDLLVLID
jgi:hypothetical protein